MNILRERGKGVIDRDAREKKESKGAKEQVNKRLRRGKQSLRCVRHTWLLMDKFEAEHRRNAVIIPFRTAFLAPPLAGSLRLHKQNHRQ